MIATNITGLVHMTRAVLPQMVERNDGLIINLGSVAGDYSYPGGNVYGGDQSLRAAILAEFALRSRRARMFASPISSRAWSTGSEFSQVRFGGDEAKAAAVYAGTQSLTPEDIAETAAWLVSLPPHVNINRIELMPTCQAGGGFVVKRQEGK